jgi:CBS domain-containing protein
MQNVSIRRVMTPVPATVEATASVVAAERLMRERKCHHVPVVRRGRVVGMLGRQDLLKALVLRAEGEGSDAESQPKIALKEWHVADVMQRDVKSLSDTSTLLDAVRAFSAGEFHALPVVGSGERLIGIVTSTDLMQVLADDLEHASGGARAAGAVDPDATATRAPELHALRDVYRAVRNYLRSGRAESEHARLLQAVEHAREALRAANVDL